MIRIPCVNPGTGKPTGEFTTREKAHRQGKNGLKDVDAVPHGHAVIRDRRGRVLVGKRIDNKMFLGGRRLPLIGGHLHEDDLVKNRYGDNVQPLEVDYPRGTSREIREETRAIIPENELELIDQREMDFSTLSGFPNRMHLRTFEAPYKPKAHGKIRVNRRELSGAKFRSPRYVRRKRLLAPMGQAYEQFLTHHLERTSRAIRAGLWYDALFKSVGDFLDRARQMGREISANARRILY